MVSYIEESVSVSVGSTISKIEEWFCGQTPSLYLPFFTIRSHLLHFLSFFFPQVPLSPIPLPSFFFLPPLINSSLLPLFLFTCFSLSFPYFLLLSPSHLPFPLPHSLYLPPSSSLSLEKKGLWRIVKKNLAKFY